VYGPLIVLEPGEKHDPEHDQTFVFSIGKYDPFGFLLLVNGSPQPQPVELHTATRYRLRLINITSNSVDLRVRLSNQGAPVKWKLVAKDGADLPAAQLKSSDAEMGITVGETYDLEYRSDNAGMADMVVGDPIFLPAGHDEVAVRRCEWRPSKTDAVNAENRKRCRCRKIKRKAH
jgi:hypothetical protein